MSYVLTLFVIAPHGELQISEKFYNEIREANKGLPEVVAVEEKFDAFMENFVELESTVLTLGARHLAFEFSEVTDFIEHRNLISRRIANFLSSGRLYRDALPQHALRILGRTHSDAKTFVSSLKDAREQPMAYRIVEVLRNYSQHKELPLSNVTFHSSRDLVERQTVAFASWLEPQIDALKLSEGRDVPGDVSTQLIRSGEKFKVMPLLREYVEYVGGLHLAFRKLIKAREEAWEASLATARECYKAQYPEESILSLGAGIKDTNGVVSNRQSVSEQGQKYRRHLRFKHLTAVNFSKRYVKWSM